MLTIEPFTSMILYGPSVTAYAFRILLRVIFCMTNSPILSETGLALTTVEHSCPFIKWHLGRCTMLQVTILEVLLQMDCSVGGLPLDPTTPAICGKPTWWTERGGDWGLKGFWREWMKDGYQQ